MNQGYFCTPTSDHKQACFEICGDGLHLGLNECDDGNTLNRDGCSHNCNIEKGFSCTTSFNGSISMCTEICGDFINLGTYDCETSMTGCTTDCKVMPGFICLGGDSLH